MFLQHLCSSCLLPVSLERLQWEDQDHPTQHQEEEEDFCSSVDPVEEEAAEADHLLAPADPAAGEAEEEEEGEVE